MFWRNRIALILVLLTFTAACSSSSEDAAAPPTVVPDATAEPTATTPAPTSSPTPPPAPTEPPPATEPPAPPPPTPVPTETPTPDSEPAQQPPVQLLNVYWLQGEDLAVSGGAVPTASPARAAIERLLSGPDFSDEQRSMETAIAEGVTLLGLTIRDGRAIVDLSPEFEAVSYGTAGELAMVAQLVFTVTQFPTVDSVDIWIDGVERDYILSHGLDAHDLTRENFYDQAPEILVEHPFAGQSVWAPFRVTGFSRTFESIVQWQLVTDGEVIASGFITANQPDVGRHGPFEFVVDLGDVDRSLLRTLQLTVFETSAEDGSTINAHVVPVFLNGSGPAPSPDVGVPFLRSDGIGPIDFGTPVDQARAILEETFGPPLRPASQIDCEGDTSSQLVWDQFQLNLSPEDTVEGWFYRFSDPPMTAASGLTPGTTLGDLVAAHPDVSFYRDTLSTEFLFSESADQIAGFVTDDGEHVVALYAGWTCFFR